MSTSFSTEDRALMRDAIARFVQEKYSFADRKATLDSPRGFSEATWTGMAELGLHGLLIDEAAGGSGGGDEELALVMEHIGRGLLLEPYLSSAVLVTDLVSTLGTPAQQQGLLPGLLTGATIGALAHGEPAMGFARSPVTTQIRAVDGALVLTGVKSFVLAGPSASLLLVSAAEADGVSLYAIAPDAPGLTMRPWRTVDGRMAAELVLEGVPVGSGNRLGAPGGAMDGIESVLDRATLAVCAEGLGAMQCLLEQTTAYVQTRRQFGQALSKFQVLQHRLVDMYIAIEEVRALLTGARHALALGRQERQAAVSAAKYKTGQAARLVGEEAIQLHGAIGMTVDLPVSHHFKRLLMVESMFGNMGFHLARFRSATRLSLT